MRMNLRMEDVRCKNASVLQSVFARRGAQGINAESRKYPRERNHTKPDSAAE
jgi:hypothetical protein